MRDIKLYIEGIKKASKNSKLINIYEYREDFKNNNLRQATKREYTEWLKGWLNNKGGNITHFYNYPFPTNMFYIATSNFTLDIILYGARAFNIIVPNHIKCSIEALGHCQIYKMDDFVLYGDVVPLYKDITYKDLLLK